jgi:hypothetical protein
MNGGSAPKKAKATPQEIDLSGGNHLNLDIILTTMDTAWKNPNQDTRRVATLKALEETVLLSAVCSTLERSHVQLVQEQLRMLCAVLK